MIAYLPIVCATIYWLLFLLFARNAVLSHEVNRDRTFVIYAITAVLQLVLALWWTFQCLRLWWLTT